RMIYLTACRLYEAAGLERVPLRLVGVRVEDLVTEDVPLQLALGESESGWREAERAVDRVSRRFGRGGVRRASLLAFAQEPDGRRDGGGRRGSRGAWADRETTSGWTSPFERSGGLVWWAYRR